MSADAQFIGDLKSGETALLMALAQIDGKPRIAMAREKAGLSPTMATNAIDGLVDLGLIERLPCRDRRTALLSLTDAGREVCAALSPVWRSR